MPGAWLPLSVVLARTRTGGGRLTCNAAGLAGWRALLLRRALGHVGAPAGDDLDQALIDQNADGLAGGEPGNAVLLHQPCL